MAKSSLFRSLKRAIRIQQQASKAGISPDTLMDRIQEAKFTRRQFLGTTIAAAGIMSMPPLLGNAWARRGAPQEPVIILGAGYAGLTAAYRLYKAGIPFMIYEAAPRIGGRVFTQNNFNKEGMFCELGAELVDTWHEPLINLAKELGLEIEDFTSFDEGFDKAVYEFQGRFYTEKDMIRDVKPLGVALNRHVSEIFGSGERQGITYKTPFNARKFDLMPLEQYLDSITDLPKWVRECIKLAYAGEFGLECSKQTALNLITFMGLDFNDRFDIFGESDESKRIKGGNSRLSEALAKAIGIASGKDSTHIQFRKELVAWKDKGTHQLLTFSSKGKARQLEVKAQQVICTIPFSRLREVDGISGLGFSERKMKAIRSLPYGTNSKLMLSFKGRPWREKRGEKEKVPASNGSLYSDRFQSVWETSRLQAGKMGILTNFTGGEMGARASKRDAAGVAGSVDRFYAGARSQFDGKSSLMNWSKSPFHHGSYSCPGPGNFTDFFGAIGEPELDGRVLFAGEHCSLESQAFMNGAVETGEAAAAMAIAGRGRKKTA